MEYLQSVKGIYIMEECVSIIDIKFLTIIIYALCRSSFLNKENFIKPC